MNFVNREITKKMAKSTRKKTKVAVPSKKAKNRQNCKKPNKSSKIRKLSFGITQMARGTAEPAGQGS
jgi:hypothetical protein